MSVVVGAVLIASSRCCAAGARLSRQLIFVEQRRLVIAIGECNAVPYLIVRVARFHCVLRYNPYFATPLVVWTCRVADNYDLIVLELSFHPSLLRAPRGGGLKATIVAILCVV